jgi:hypothetical protein
MGEGVAPGISRGSVAGAVSRGEGQAGVGRLAVGPVAEAQMDAEVGIDLGDESGEGVVLVEQVLDGGPGLAIVAGERDLRLPGCRAWGEKWRR